MFYARSVVFYGKEDLSPGTVDGDAV